MKPILRILPLAVLPLVLLLAAVPARADAGVPRVEGVTLDQALAQLHAAGLEAQVTWSADLAAGRVGQQSPPAGTRVANGSVVDLLVGILVPVDTIVPSVVGLDEESAARALDALYALDFQDVAAPPNQDGLVVAQDPQPGAHLAYRGTLRLSVGRARASAETTSVPSVEGRGLREAEQTLLRAGLVADSTFVRAPGNRREWRILRQDPTAGTAVPLGTRVRLQVAMPSASPALLVPSLLGLSQEEAARLLTSLGLQGVFERIPSRFGRESVLRQDPEAGSSVPAGTRVHVVVAVPGGPLGLASRVVVPDLGGRRLADVWQSVRAAGLRVEVRRQVAPDSPVDRVLAQRPAPGARVPVGTAVELVLPATATVPSLVGLSVEDATAVVGRASLRMLLEGGPRGRGARVGGQDPPPGTTVAAGSTVRASLHGHRGGPPGGRAGLVPDLVGHTIDEARGLLQAVGLQPDFRGPVLVPEATTEVVEQHPNAGTALPPGSVVTVVYRVRPAPAVEFVRVPDLAGQSLQDAQARLTAAGLVPRPSVVRGGGPPGVLGQEPRAGTLVRRGAEVRFTVRR